MWTVKVNKRYIEYGQEVQEEITKETLLITDQNKIKEMNDMCLWLYVFVSINNHHNISNVYVKINSVTSSQPMIGLKKFYISEKKLYQVRKGVNTIIMSYINVYMILYVTILITKHMLEYGQFCQTSLFLLLYKSKIL